MDDAPYAVGFNLTVGSGRLLRCWPTCHAYKKGNISYRRHSILYRYLSDGGEWILHRSTGYADARYGKTWTEEAGKSVTKGKKTSGRSQIKSARARDILFYLSAIYIYSSFDIYLTFIWGLKTNLMRSGGKTRVILFNIYGFWFEIWTWLTLF